MMSDLSSLIAGLSPEKRALLELRLKRIDNSLPQNQITPAREKGGPIPASFAQQRLWLLDQIEPNNSHYNISKVMRVVGPVSGGVLQKALDAIVERHEALRTTFISVNGGVEQVVGESRPVNLSIFDLTHCSSSEREAKVQALLRQLSNQTFDLSRDLMLRASLLRLDKELHILLLVMHHIASDGRSIRILFKELAVLYQAFASGRPSPLPELAIQYSDYAQWQRQWLQGERIESQVSYWKKQLAGIPPFLDLPTDRPRPSFQTHYGARYPFTLRESTAGSLTELCRQEGVTLFMALAAAFSVLLYRYTDQEDIVVGTPIAGRSQPELEGLIGFFVNTLVLRSDLSGNPPFREILSRVRKVALGAYEHQDLPFEKLVAELHPDRNPNRTPLFQVMFSFQYPRMPSVYLGDCKLIPFDTDPGTAMFDLTLFVAETKQGLMGEWEYNTDLFETATVVRMAGHFLTVLEGIVADPTQRISELPLLNAAERHQFLVEWNDTAAAYPQDRLIHQFFEAQVKRLPEASALVYQQQGLTYRELNARANQLAHYLRRMGVKPGMLVGLCLERSLEMVMGLLGILKAGGAYVPLDSTFPKERLSYMLEDSGAKILLTQSSLSEALTSESSVRVFLDTEWKKIAQESSRNPSAMGRPEDLAYVIYTSGSTGKPKGVQIEHRSVVNLLESMRREPGITESDVLLAVTTLSFDIAGLELYLPLISGARLIIANQDVAADGTQLAKLMVSSGTTLMQATPATWRLLLDSGWTGRSNLKILCGGEALPKDLAQQLLAKCASLWNLYGPTETTIWSTVCRVNPDDTTISIGRPIANTQIYILDDRKQPVPIGVTGELHIGGDGLARGYLNRPELTAEKFIPHPFSQDPTARLYNTGDLARYRADGRIECLGRSDHQVKLRGFRIELGEIEAVLAQHPGVKQAVAMIREDTPGDRRLVAYLVAGADQDEPSFSTLRKALRAHLPDYMIPAAFVRLDAMPLTPNGKIDRQALPRPEGSRPELERTFRAPRTPVEQVIAGMWTQVIGLERVGVEDNFFDLGGHSLLATRVISRMRETFNVELPLRRFFESPTIDGLADAILKDPEQRSKVEKRAEVILRLSQLSDDQVRAMLDERGVAEGSSKVQ